MENTPAKSQIKKTFSKKFIIIGSVGFVVFAGLAVLALLIVHQINVTNTVKAALVTASSAIEKASGSNGFQVELPTGMPIDKKVHLEGGGSFDGTVYCVTGKSVDNPSVVYYIDSSSKKPQKGTCQSAANLPKPSVITSIYSDTVSTTQAHFTWTRSTYGASYALQCATDQDFSSNLTSATNSSVTGVCDGLKDGTAYFARVRANNVSGTGPWSPVITVTTDSLSSAPVNLTTTTVSSTSIHYSWNIVGSAQSYVVEWSTDVNFMQNLKTVATTNTSGTASGLTPNTRYFFHVKAATANFDAAHATFSQEVYTSTLAN